VSVSRREASIAEILAFRGGEHAVIAAIAAETGVEPPRGPGAVFAEGAAILALRPGVWWIFDAPDASRARLAASLEGRAALVDQSGGRVVFDLSGGGVDALLARGCALDLDRFGPGSAAVTSIGQIGVVLWRGPAATHLAAPRSMAGSFAQWISRAGRAVPSAG
jgi:sarcosine oxidase subunit gamma